MGLKDFLFNGQAPKSVTKYGKTINTLPQWFSDFQQAIAAKGNTLAAQPYQVYGGPRIADFNKTQRNAFQATTKMMGDAGRQIDRSQNLALQTAKNADATATAMPWLNKSGQSAADIVGDYMSPHTDAVVNRIGELGARNLSENLMPAINSDFIRAGQYGSTGQMNEVGKALRDTQESVLAQQNQALETAYQSSLGAAQNDLSRYGQLGQTAGNLSNMDTQSRLDGFKTSGALATLAQDSRYKDINALGAVGNAKQDMTQGNLNLAYQDWSNQNNWQKDQLGWLNNLAKGFQVPTSQYTSDTGPLPGAQFQSSPFMSAIGSSLAAYNYLK